MDERKAIPAEIESALAAILEQPPAQAAAVLALVAHRATATLHGLANRQAKGSKGSADWANWARLVNATRAMVLQAAACRDAAKQL